ncbi:hypothetical protein GQ43DRAFT_464844 [Delitschia confertaspora ATCC 74209]|uniref:RNA polymerase II assembly factor Rtp1 C-terminal domain-containing protein n=1 Tax=Delitschia confertaspora ATCC 74209 TaxID=1513339 RepID=A0A9P4JHU9_9PLEO|nr:hypothetical protein GQ43DRAFT_464844 [Delitschia confertaspora ATCC 74209]
MTKLEEVIDAGADFIKPFLQKGQDQSNQGEEDLPIPRDQLVEQSLVHLRAIHEADRTRDVNEPYDGALFGVVYGLVDMITLQGILPSLSPGVSFSQRPRSVLKPSLSIPSHRDNFLLAQVISALLSIFEQDNSGIQPLISQRSLPDLISGVTELAFSPKATEKSRGDFQGQHAKLLNRCPTSRLLPILTSYLQQDDAPVWFKQKISKELTLVPLRPHGVRHTIDFVSLSYLSQSASGVPDTSQKIPVPVEAVRHVSRLLASVPDGINPDDWFSELAPQIWNLIDGEGGEELSRAAGQIIAAGILGHKSTGAPGTAGWKTFAEPILRAIRPEARKIGSPTREGFDTALVSDTDLMLSLKRLSVIVMSHSHAGLVKRLIHPVLLPLWALMQYASCKGSRGNQKVSHLGMQWTELPRQILSRYMVLSLDPKQIEAIVDNIFWDGESSWTFGPGSQGGVEIQQRTNDDRPGHDFGRLIMQIEVLDGRVQSLMDLLSETGVQDDAVSAVFLAVTKRWLALGTTRTPPKDGLESHGDTTVEPLVAMAYAKLSQTMATKFQRKFTRRPAHVMELVAQLLQDFVQKHNLELRENTNTSKASLFDLRNIVDKRSATPRSQVDQKSNMSPDSESEDLVSFALSILNVIVASPEFKKTSDTDKVISQILPSLEYLGKGQQHSRLPLGIVNASQNLLTFFTRTRSSDVRVVPERVRDSSRETLKTALADLTSDEPPSRAWGLSTLEILVQDPKAFHLIDIPATTHMILSTALVDSESFVYSAGISTIVRFAAVSPNPVLRILIDAYMDKDEMALERVKDRDLTQALDFRLRLGEVLNKFALESSFWNMRADTTNRHHAMDLLIEATLSLGSRRGQRSKSLLRRHDVAEKERLEQEEAEAAWEGPVPDLFSEEEDESEAQKKEREVIANIVEGWQSTGLEEDVRVRASALSILGCILEHRLEFFTQNKIHAALQMVVTILILETSADKAIVRRAAVLVLMGCLRGVDQEVQEGRQNTFTFGSRQSEEVERTLKWVRDEDNDGLVRSHAADVIEGLDTLRMKQLYGLMDYKDRIQGLQLDAGEGLKGLDINPLANREEGKRKVSLVEEVE